MREKTDNLRIKSRKSLLSASILVDELPISDKALEIVLEARDAISQCIHGHDDRLVVVVGPCSIHDYDAAIEYAEKLKVKAKDLKNELVIVMRVYFEKPRTTVGWKGFINDPDLDDSFNINKGLRTARQLLLDINGMGLPAGTEYLDVISPQYVADLISWGAIGARTTESQVHRELASGISCPVGFKNGTDGGAQVAIDAIGASQSGHHFLSVTKNGTAAIYETEGNGDCHVILRGGKSGPNYDEKSVNEAFEQQAKSNVYAKIMVDCSHGNSQKDFNRQPIVSNEIADYIAHGNKQVFGLMIESHLVEGNQKISDDMVYGQSITDACVSWGNTEKMLEILAAAVKTRREISVK
ncbi:3-deoxy-7-phosphoheptulonate synthase [Francisellaceae bacterium]|nr:3-deoxy-7-phosphoheptulonate synthase [Francisellaceae bacterium]